MPWWHSRPKISPQVIAEVRCFWAYPFNSLRWVTLISKNVWRWRTKTIRSEAMQMVEGLWDELDLFARFADLVPETEDLMEQEDDAPIIRLINALLTEAVKLNASDIHIETFERRLIVMRVDGVLRNRSTQTHLHRYWCRVSR